MRYVCTKCLIGKDVSEEKVSLPFICDSCAIVKSPIPPLSDEFTNKMLGRIKSLIMNFEKEVYEAHTESRGTINASATILCSFIGTIVNRIAAKEKTTPENILDLTIAQVKDMLDKREFTNHTSNLQ